MPRIDVAGDICLRRPRSTQGCRADDDDDDDDILHFNFVKNGNCTQAAPWILSCYICPCEIFVSTCLIMV
jgi:hypothetical protein